MSCDTAGYAAAKHVATRLDPGMKLATGDCARHFPDPRAGGCMSRAGSSDAGSAQAHPGGQWFGVLRQGDGCVGVPARSPVRIHPAGSPKDNSHIESFNGKLRGKCLNVSVSHTMEDARHILEPWRVICTMKPGLTGHLGPYPQVISPRPQTAAKECLPQILYRVAVQLQGISIPPKKPLIHIGPLYWDTVSRPTVFASRWLLI
jgi:hypothetical protein